MKQGKAAIKLSILSCWRRSGSDIKTNQVLSAWLKWNVFSFILTTNKISSQLVWFFTEGRQADGLGAGWGRVSPLIEIWFVQPIIKQSGLSMTSRNCDCVSSAGDEDRSLDSMPPVHYAHRVMSFFHSIWLALPSTARQKERTPGQILLPAVALMNSSL